MTLPDSNTSVVATATLAVIAGGGTLPLRVMQACRDQGRPFRIIALEGQADPAVWADCDPPVTWISLGRAFESAERLRDEGITHLCMAGAVKRPSFAGVFKMLPDLKTAGFMARVGAQALGDDSLLTAIIDEMEREGFCIEAPHDVIGPILAGVGVLGDVRPDAQARADLKHAFTLAKALGRLDVGQGAVVQQGLALALEAIEGTDAMLSRVRSLSREGLGGVLVKAAKPQQDRRVDLPAIGPRTVELVDQAGLRGIGVEAGSTLLIDDDRVIRWANRKGLFVVGLDDEGAFE